MQLKNRRDMMRFAAGVTAGACIVVTITILMLYPPDQWAFELTLSLSLTVGICFPVTSFMARQVHRNKLLTDELQRLVDRDRLTDAATRDFFFSRMAEAPNAYGVSLMVDIDHFKQVNDTYGHLTGDHVITEVARILRADVREKDIVCRFGGEEFVIFLQERDEADGFAAAERMRKMIAAQKIVLRDAELSVTVSIGGSLKERVEDVEHSIHEADAALYRAKTQGRNRTVFGPPGMAQTKPKLVAGG